MEKIGVFCGSRAGSSPLYSEMALKLGEVLFRNGIDLIYGGGDIGLMKQVADSVLGLGGNVIGVIPEFLYDKEVAHLGLTELIIVDSMHQRKAKVAELSDGLITLPGGFGTLDETFEMLTWNQLHLHSKSFGLLNIDGYFDKLLEFIDRMVRDKFLKSEDRSMIQVSEDPEQLLAKMREPKIPSNPKWVGVKDND
jgi:uncharacterized protein (TIGR00730 family)